VEDAAEVVEGAGWVGKLFGFLLAIWALLPDSNKTKIIDAIVEGFTKTLGAFFDRAHDWVKGKDEPDADIEAAA